MPIFSRAEWCIRTNGTYHHGYDSSHNISGDKPDDLWPEIAAAMVHTKNIRPPRLSEGKTPHELFENEVPALDHFGVLGSTVYVLIYEEREMDGRIRSLHEFSKIENPVLERLVAL